MPSITAIFLEFLRLGLHCFGGPAAHLVVFRQHFVDKRTWIDDAQFQQFLALSQFLPGPASSQVGFAIGLSRGGLKGGLAAFAGFTLPSFVLMLALALLLSQSGTAIDGLLHGLKLLALVVVADATRSMFGGFCQDTPSQVLAIVTAAILIAMPSASMQITVLCCAALFGAWRSKPGAQHSNNAASHFKVIPLILFATLFFALPLLAAWSPTLTLFNQFYQSGSLVFGGGHVVLPLLQNGLGDSISDDRFLLAYGAAQAVPGPMFSIAAFLGADLTPDAPVWGALVATVGLFLPGFLLLYAVRGAWQSWAERPRIAGAVAAVNASVVGLLMAALYQPVFVSAVASPLDMSVALLGFALLRILKWPLLWVLAALLSYGVFNAYTVV